MGERQGFDAVVLAGGRGSRLGGADKAALELDGERLVARAVAAARGAGAKRVVVVGPDSSAVEGARIAREDPPFTGPLAALAAGLDALPEDSAEQVLLLACDLVDPAAVCRALLAEELSGRDGVALSDPDGRRQWLAGRYSRAMLRENIATLRAKDSDGSAGQDPTRNPLANLPVRLAFARAKIVWIPAPHTATADIDTVEDLERARISQNK